MVQMCDLHKGDRVKIVDLWVPGCHQNSDGLMDQYLGSVMTVRYVSESFCNLVEDREDLRPTGWTWYPASIEYIVGKDDGSDCKEYDLLPLSELYESGVL